MQKKIRERSNMYIKQIILEEKKQKKNDKRRKRRKNKNKVCQNVYI